MLSELELRIKNYAEKYYIGETEISDVEFDSLVDELRAINPESEILKSVGWGSGVERISGNKRPHKYGLVGSLEKYKEIDSIPYYDGAVLSAKLDGLSCVLYYTDGNLDYALTRGNGEEGIDITNKVVRILKYNTKLNTNFTGAIRGELVFSNKDWNRYKDIHPEYNDPSKNPRNIAAGIINRKDDTSDDIDFVSLVVYNIVASDGYKLDDQIQVYNYLRSNFINVCPHSFFLVSDNMWRDRLLFESMYEEFKKEYPCDGIVVGYPGLKSDNKSVVYDQIAFKFDAESAETVVNGIEWTVTRTGKVTPVLLVDTVQISGTNVSRCTAYNAKYIVDNNIKVGSRIEIQKSNEIIPKVVRVLDC